MNAHYGESPARKCYYWWWLLEEFNKMRMQMMQTYALCEREPEVDKPVIVSEICGSKKD